jgi:hypothetical protein
MVEIFYLLSQPVSPLKKRILNIVLIIYVITITFSGSRRGFIVLSTGILFLLFLQLVTLFKKNSSLKKLAVSSRNFLLSSSIMALLLIGFVFIVPIQMKKNSLSFLGISVKSYKNLISSGLFRYSSIFSNPVYSHILGKVWIENPNPYNPDSGWDSRVSSQVFPLFGENVDIVPQKSIGYKMDNTCNATSWNNNSYSYTDISVLFHGNSVDTINKSYLASVYCLVSEDFDGTWAGISAEGTTSAQCYQFYDLNKKGTWQKLQIAFKSKSGIPFVYLYWSKYGVKDFSSLKGYVIYAFPQYMITNKIDSTNLFLNTLVNKNRKLLINSFIDYDTNISFSQNVSQLNKKNNFNFLNIDLNNEQISLKHQELSLNYYDINQNKASLYASFIPLLNNLFQMGIDRDPIRKWVSRFISEDTTYFGYKQNLVVDTISNKFLAGRLLRWEFAYEVYTKEYNWKQKILGGGFNFLNWYGYRFLKDKKASDYPHNPFLSVLLYSGIVGLLIYLVFFYKAVYYYIKYIREYPILAIFFAITFFFSFFSAGSPFDPPIMGFFMIFPFFIHHIHKNSESINQSIDKL